MYQYKSPCFCNFVISFPPGIPGAYFRKNIPLTNSLAYNFNLCVVALKNLFTKTSPAIDASNGQTIIHDNKRMRLFVACFFFSQGICFSSWASRIPDIKTKLMLDEAGLGTILLALPAGQLTAMPFSGRLVTKYGSKQMLTIALPLYAFAMTNMGWVAEKWQLALVLYFFGLCGNLSNISVNTQAIAVEGLYKKPIMASFHGAWSLAGFTGAAIGTLFVSQHIVPYIHFCCIAVLVWIIAFFSHKHLYPVKAAMSAKKSFFSKPDNSLAILGLIAFCCMAAEGAMFDWSGVYFQKVVQAPASLVPLGYAAFMSTMAGGRFAGDWLVSKLGRKKMLETSGFLICIGLMISVLFTHIITVTIGFLIVGFGVSSVVPAVYSAAGRHKTISPGMALAGVSSISFLGFLMGPPMIGYIAQALNLRYSFAVVAVLGLCISWLVAKSSLIKNK